MINGSAIVHDSTIFLRDTLLNNVTDPISGARSSNSRFVMSSYPERPAEYPMITVKANINGDAMLGISSESRQVGISFETRIWARNQKEKDEIADDVYDTLRTYQLDTNESVANGLYGFRIVNMFDLDEAGKGAPKSKVIEGRYFVIAQ